MQTHWVTLTDVEMLLLDGKVTTEVQKKIGCIKNAKSIDLPDIQAQMVAKIVQEAKSNGILYIRRSLSDTGCSCCGYHPGRLNPRGKQLFGKSRCHAKYFIGSGEICLLCIDAVVPVLANELEEIPVEIIGCVGNIKSTGWTKSKNVQCKTCKWTGHKLEMKKRQAFLGDHSVIGKCPKCGNEGNLFDSAYIELPGFVMVKEDAAK